MFKENLSILIVICSIFILLSCQVEDKEQCPTSKCSDYTTQQDAQAAFNANRLCYSDLDSDNDGTACEHLPSRDNNNGCPTTANCGCSGKNKNECGGPCCQWIVGTGCKCG
ncbi:hypothetical protein GCM10011506_35970 [Marivirga lumbricoides]|uniref:Excalibur calcium-binding domain-containing protein n=1 Tax=Marivirga lumbricoides TaxID=1046115 RepID=A0ABQ1MV54_9BACT|nr:hypothetical protein GCM10011506_35970 [Marivirga lumbricoides]